MYYEEKQNSNGRIYWRNTPNGDWVEFNQVQYAERLTTLQAKLEAAEKACAEIIPYANEGVHTAIAVQESKHLPNAHSISASIEIDRLREIYRKFFAIASDKE